MLYCCAVMKMLKFKQANEKDIALIEYLYSTRLQQLHDKGIEQWSEEEITWPQLSKIYDVSHFYIVYKNEEACGAFVMADYDPLYWRDDKPKDALYIHKVMVLESVSGTGVSDAILAYFKEEAKRRGYPVAKLDVREYKTKLRSFYERNGFKLYKTVDLGKGYPICLYHCPLL